MACSNGPLGQTHRLGGHMEAGVIAEHHKLLKTLGPGPDQILLGDLTSLERDFKPYPRHEAKLVFQLVASKPLRSVQNHDDN